MKFKPSNLLCEGDYPFSNYENNSYIYSLFGGYHFFYSDSGKFVMWFYDLKINCLTYNINFKSLMEDKKLKGKPISELGPRELLEKFENHSVCKSKCTTETTALKVCFDFYSER